MKPILTIILALSFFSLLAQNTSCADTSYRMQFFSPGKDFRFYTHCNTADGGTVLIGRISDTLTNASNIVVIKLNTTGGLVWKTAFQNLEGSDSYFARIIEQSNGELAAYGHSRMGTPVRKIILLKLTAAGALIWSNRYGLNSHFDAGDLLHPYFLSEGLNHDLLFTIGGEHGENSSDSVYALTVRINNNGNIVWSKAFTNDPVTWWMYPSGIYEKNGEVFTFGYVDNTVGPCALGINLSPYAIKMNYNTGQPLIIKSYCHSDVVSTSFESGGSTERDYFNSVRLVNNQFALFGRLSTVTDKRYGYKVVFDDQLNIVRAKQYDVPKTDASTLARLSVLPDGTTHFFYLGANLTTKQIYWAALDSTDKIIRQRKMLLNQVGTGFGGYLNFNYRNSEMYNFSTYYRINDRRYSLFTQIQRNDPSLDSCLGTDTAFVGSGSIGWSPTNWTWKSIIDNPVVSTPVTLLPSDFSIETENLCTQISRCDSLRISAPDTVCVANSFINFTGLKNPDCRKRVLWEFDNALIDSSYQPNDSTLSLRFKTNLQTVQPLRLFASAANCTIARDTAQIVLLPGVKPLPPDTVVCGAVNLRLTPGKWGNNYLWQDGSTDSVFTATDTGRYTVQVQPFCGPLFYDTINITQPRISLGPGISKCSGDTVTLRAGKGFTSYQWSPGTALINVADSVVKVFPKAPTQYIVKAQTNGCTVSDTVLVNVFPSTPVHLGRDTSFCQGDSLQLQAASFNNYQWSTGSAASSVYVKASGIYWVKAVDGNGCSSTDSLTILPLYARPAVTILPEDAVCTGQTDTLRVTPGFTSYQWQNGSVADFLPINAAGTYWVRVTDNNGCTGTGTAVITKLVSPPGFFLSGDMVICAGVPVELKPVTNFNRYLWSNGATAPSIEVSSAGLYTLEVRDADNCRGKDSIIVTLKNCPNRIYFPSAFSPNGDGKNDLLKPFVEGRMLSYFFTVYNRWGQIVFSTTDYRNGWNGMLGSLLQNTGAFVWLCRYQFTGEDKKVEKGTVMLVR